MPHPWIARELERRVNDFHHRPTMVHGDCKPLDSSCAHALWRGEGYRRIRRSRTEKQRIECPTTERKQERSAFPICEGLRDYRTLTGNGRGIGLSRKPGSRLASVEFRLSAFVDQSHQSRRLFPRISFWQRRCSPCRYLVRLNSPVRLWRSMHEGLCYPYHTEHKNLTLSANVRAELRFVSGSKG